MLSALLCVGPLHQACRPSLTGGPCILLGRIGPGPAPGSCSKRRRRPPLVRRCRWGHHIILPLFGGSSVCSCLKAASWGLPVRELQALTGSARRVARLLGTLHLGYADVVGRRAPGPRAGGRESRAGARPTPPARPCMRAGGLSWWAGRSMHGSDGRRADTTGRPADTTGLAAAKHSYRLLQKSHHVNAPAF
jgi:hypothetical protein